MPKTADAGRADSFMSSGQLEIKQFIIPGWAAQAARTANFLATPGSITPSTSLPIGASISERPT